MKRDSWVWRKFYGIADSTIVLIFYGKEYEFDLGLELVLNVDPRIDQIVDEFDNVWWTKCPNQSASQKY